MILNISLYQYQESTQMFYDFAQHDMHMTFSFENRIDI
jgi:hypothetical protein